MDPLRYSQPQEPSPNGSGITPRDVTQPTVDWTLDSGLRPPIPDVTPPDARPYLAPAAPILQNRPIPDDVKPKVIGGRPYIG